MQQGEKYEAWQLFMHIDSETRAVNVQIVQCMKVLPEHVWSMWKAGHWSADCNIIYCPITIVAYFELLPWD